MAGSRRGKFRISPKADLYDGLLDVYILNAVAQWRVPGYVLKYLQGTRIHDAEVIYRKALPQSRFF